ncbi:hypothetical protein, partial [Micromonospora avicenniae]|uniref:hypothetical protein n=1 Tax=Micromonospora avicenniae TaxID=1198245 RepID=UPI003445B2EA
LDERPLAVDLLVQLGLGQEPGAVERRLPPSRTSGRGPARVVRQRFRTNTATRRGGTANVPVARSDEATRSTGSCRPYRKALGRRRVRDRRR